MSQPADPLEAAVEVLREAAEPLHWTVIQDRALRRGLIDPFTTPNVRRHLLAALHRGVDDGAVRAVGKGVYEIVPPVADA
ncbi:MAG: winged helix-turn-helix domain-containing protein [Actinomycetota bacterium]|nr:winged helix-turn-helix domain-containing protein [Actinomycetota bacterium]MDH5224143.1 winged helix-turn-helix domain-containing protein [Actinomycetota bacterium]MDH5312307.1 winged helix-turn-helix domain-containing protein [Actinomycetota bacterium]